MVREVEFSNQLELLNDDAEYSTKLGVEIFDGYLSNEGKTLTINVNKDAPHSGARQLLLYYSDIDFKSNSINYVFLGQSDFSPQPQYTFDISSIPIIFTSVLMKLFLAYPINGYLSTLY